MEILDGLGVSEGVVIGRAFVMDASRSQITRRRINPKDVEDELARFNRARIASRVELTTVYDDAREQMGDESANIFVFHMGMLEDETLLAPIRDMIKDDRVAAEYAVSVIFQQWAEKFGTMPNAAFRSKADDMRDLADRVVSHLIGQRTTTLADVPSGTIVIARDLTPSQTVALDRTRILGFATDLGGRTGHTAIVANSLGIPAVVGCRNATIHALDGQMVIVDGDRERVIIDPDEATITEYRGYIEHRELRRLSLTELAGLESITTDGQAIELMGNIEFPEEIEHVIETGGQGVGLYRTEFLYLAADNARGGPGEPSEDDHYQAYSRCVEQLGGKPLTIRTFDLGADKYTQAQMQYRAPERNPFLGLRSIRYCLKHPAGFKTQLRAILRASAHGPIRVMFPLVTSVGEFREARLHLRDAMEDLAEEGVAFDADLPVGMMVESPSSAILADRFAKDADFFSIGTNDLVQYTLAVDRTSEQVAYLYEPTHPAVLRMIRETVRGARSGKIPVSVCGETAADPLYATLLIGLGLRTLSVSASVLPKLKRVVRSVSIKQCERIAKHAITLESTAQVSAYVRDRARKILPEDLGGRAAD